MPESDNKTQSSLPHNNSSLLENEELTQNPQEIIFLKDKDQNFICGSDFAKELINKRYEQLNDCSFDCSRLFDDEENEHNKVILKNESSSSEKMTLDSSGNEHWYKVYKSPVFDEENRLFGVNTVIQNIDKEKAKENRQNLFLATLAHDLKNIQQAQIRSLELLLKGTFGEISEAQKEMLEMTVESSKFMKNLLLSISKTYKDNNGLIVLEKTNFDLNALILKCIKEIECLCFEKNVNILFNSKLNEENSTIYADETQIRRVIENLLNNVVIHAHENTVINVVAQANENDICLSFENQSNVIPKEMQEKIFEKYVSSLKSKFSVGLGLYFCKKVVDAHSGMIYLDCKDETNKFVIKMPKAENSNNLIKEIIL